MSRSAGREAAPAGSDERIDGSSGTPVLLLHGQPGSARDWSLVVSELNGRANPIPIDRPGWDGRSPAGGLAHNARAAVSELDARDIDRAIVVGLSFGGAVAAWLAVHHAERVRGLVLVAPAANTASLQPVDRLLALPVAGPAASAALLAGAGIALASPRIRGSLEGAFGLPDDYLRSSARRLRTREAWRSFVVEQRTLLADLPALEPRLPGIKAPTTILIGTADTVVPRAAGRLLAGQIPGAELVEIEGAHHVLAAEHPRRVAEAIAQLCEGTGSAPAARN